MGDLPRELREAMERVLDADAESDRSPTPLSSDARIERLRAARSIVAGWRRGDVGLEAAIGRLNALAISCERA